jgi:hypothetical protein
VSRDYIDDRRDQHYRDAADERRTPVTLELSTRLTAGLELPERPDLELSPSSVTTGSPPGVGGQACSDFRGVRSLIAAVP